MSEMMKPVSSILKAHNTIESNYNLVKDIHENVEKHHAEANKNKVFVPSKTRQVKLLNRKDDSGVLEVPEEYLLIVSGDKKRTTCKIFLKPKHVEHYGFSADDIVKSLVPNLNFYGKIEHIVITDVRPPRSNTPGPIICVDVSFTENSSFLQLMNDAMGLQFGTDKIDTDYLLIKSSPNQTQLVFLYPQHNLIVYDKRLQTCGKNNTFMGTSSCDSELKFTEIWVGEDVKKLIIGRPLQVYRNTIETNFVQKNILNSYDYEYRTVAKYKCHSQAAVILSMWEKAGYWCGHVCKN